MTKQVLFIQGAGEGAHEADAKLSESLGRALGSGYEVIFPAMPNEADIQYDEWKSVIEQALTQTQEPLILAGHSVGASIFLKCLSEIKARRVVDGIFLIASPFWGGDGWLYDGYERLELSEAAIGNLPRNVPVFLYYCQDDDTVPSEHMMLYAKLLPHATKRRLEEGGHQFNNDLSLVAEDIKNLESS